jgi:hypothetical protein
MPFTWLDRSGRKTKAAKLRWIALGIVALFALVICFG